MGALSTVLRYFLCVFFEDFCVFVVFPPALRVDLNHGLHCILLLCLLLGCDVVG